MSCKTGHMSDSVSLLPRLAPTHCRSPLLSLPSATNTGSNKTSPQREQPASDLIHSGPRRLGALVFKVPLFATIVAFDVLEASCLEPPMQAHARYGSDRWKHTYVTCLCGRSSPAGAQALRFLPFPSPFSCPFRRPFLGACPSACLAYIHRHGSRTHTDR